MAERVNRSNCVSGRIFRYVAPGVRRVGSGLSKEQATLLRIDTHHHAIPSFYRDLLRKARIDEAGGRELPA
ncbi:hypothetical protein [Mycobacterium sp. 852002-51971_SCH5477799-a]|uniref:hypothetical protein n=1 Tax=Mycobacterium sp. 852002-51971_SCH5477799-a TaxID=1834106 RepID=UPI000A57CFE0